MNAEIAEAAPVDVAGDRLPVDGPTTASHLRSALDALLDGPDQAVLRRLLEQARVDADAVAMRSYLHPNGFYKLVLHSCDRFQLRLHVWPPGENRCGEADPHDHRWHFASTVLSGAGLLNVLLCEAERGTEKFRRHIYSGRQARLVSDELVLLKVLDEQPILTGDRYVMASTAVHTVRPLGDGMVATFVVQGPRITDDNRVYRPDGASDEQIIGVVDAVLVDQLIASVLDSLPGTTRPTS